MRSLVAVNGTEAAMETLGTAVERSRTGEELTVAVYGEAVEATERRVRDRLTAVDADIRVERLEGDPGATLVERAERRGYDRIVLPGGPSTPLEKVQVGTTAEFVLTNARTTVTLVR